MTKGQTINNFTHMDHNVNKRTFLSILKALGNLK